MRAKKIWAALLAATLMLSAAGCGGPGGEQSQSPSPSGEAAQSGGEESASPSDGAQESITGWRAASVVTLALAHSGAEDMDDEELQWIVLSENADDAAYYVENAYGLDMDLLEDFAVVRGQGASALEIATFQVRDSADCDTVSEALNTYLPLREADFTGYVPSQADMVSEGLVRTYDRYVCLFICPDSNLAAATTEATLYKKPIALPEEPSESPAPEEPSPSPTPEETPEPEETPRPVDRSKVQIPVINSMTFGTVGEGPRDPNYPDRLAFSPPKAVDMTVYDTSAILAAWESGDDSGLSEKDLATLNAARDVLSSVLVEGMTSLEKEIAIYHWCVVNFDYDHTLEDVMAETPRESFEPYGGLVNHKTVCLGSATTFQLLMDMVGIECITVIGADDSNRSDHAWNMVKLYGDWYCVDSGWDSNIREDGRSNGWEWSYFNVTSDYLAYCLHQWDYANTPEAVTPGYGGLYRADGI